MEILLILRLICGLSNYITIFNQFVPQKDRLLYRIGEGKTFEENMFAICGIKFTRL